jgi:pimeloyl-ACP methyl ester carboxylesterase
MGSADAAPVAQSPLAQLYPKVDWGKLFGKLGDLLRPDYDWSAEVAAIDAPTMLVFADADAVSMAHVTEFFGLLGGGQRDAGLDGSGRPNGRLAVLPGLTHYDISSAPALAAAVAPFLDAPGPQPGC